MEKIATALAVALVALAIAAIVLTLMDPHGKVVYVRPLGIELRIDK